MRAEFEHDEDEDKDRPDLKEGLGMILEGAGLVGKIIVEVHVRPWFHIVLTNGGSTQIHFLILSFGTKRLNLQH